MSDDYLVRHAAPTRAGIKTASLFTCPYQSKDQLMKSVRQWNKRLVPKGLRVLPLRFSDKKALIYLYRPQMLSTDLSDSTAIRILEECGYQDRRREKCIIRLIQKLRQQEDFPHEIGLFLGYPPKDVIGFIECGPDCCKCCGCWKVYSDEESAKKKFAQYKKCTRVYWEQWSKGKDIERLTVTSRAG